MADKPVLTEEGLAALIGYAGDELAARAPNLVILIARLLPLDEIRPNDHGWALLGRLYSPGNKNWWSVLWHLEEGRGRLLRYHWESPSTANEFERKLKRD
jgi:hypothetical protein